MGKLYTIATPIGNLSDISLRALEALKSVDAIICEDTRVTKKLLDRYQINKLLISYHQHSQIVKIDTIVELLKSGKNIALVTDAGTPGINDPGGILIAEAIKENICIIPIPGASAMTVLLSISGIDADRFIFLGFIPKKKGRKTFFDNCIKMLAIFNLPVVIYESPYRILKTLKDFSKINDFNVIIGREMTKKFEEIIRGDIKTVITGFEKNKYKQKGEFVLCLKQK